MAYPVLKAPVTRETHAVSLPSVQSRQSLESLQRQIDHQFGSFGRDIPQPFRHSLFGAR